MSEKHANHYMDNSDGKEITELSPEQIFQIYNLWDNSPVDSPPSLRDIAIKIFGPNVDTREKRVKLIKQALAIKGLKPALQTELAPKRKLLELTLDQKEYISHHCANMNNLDMAKEIFKDNKLTGFTWECRLVTEYVKFLPDHIKGDNPDDISGLKYNPPKSVYKAMRKVNKYILNAIREEEIDKNTKLQKQMNNLIGFLHMFRFLLLMNTFTSLKDKELFEASYVRYVWNALDITEADLDLICNLCLDIVNYTNLQSQLDSLRDMRDKCLDDNEGRKLSMSMVEEMKNIRKDMDENSKRQNATIKSLQGTRNDRAESKLKENKSVIQLMEAWQEEERRLKVIAYANRKKVDVKTEINRLDSLDSIKVEIFGLSADAY